MRVKTILLLAAVTIPVAALAVLLPDPGAGTGTAPAVAGRLLADLPSHEDALAQITIAGPDGVVTLSRSPVPGKPGEGWHFKEKGGYPVPPATILPVIEALASLHGVAPKTAQAKLYPRLDLGEPGQGSQSRLVTLYDAKGAALGSIVLGKHKEATGPGGAARIYARVPGQAGTWLAAPAVTLPAAALDWLDRATLDIDTDKLKQAVLTQPGSPSVEFAREKPSDKLDVRDVPAGRKLKSDSAGSDLVDALGGLDFDDVKPEAALGGSQAGSVHLVMFDGLTADMALRKDNGNTWAVITASGPGSAPMTARTHGWAYEIPSDRAATLTASMDSLLEAKK